MSDVLWKSANSRMLVTVSFPAKASEDV